MNAKKVVDLAERRALKAFLKRCDEAVDIFPLYVLDEQHRVVKLTGPVETKLTRWADFKRDQRNIRVAETTVGDTWVSTVFLGTDQRMGLGAGPPTVFETMFFRPGSSDTFDRYETWDQALAGHERAVRSLTNAA